MSSSKWLFVFKLVIGTLLISGSVPIVPCAYADEQPLTPTQGLKDICLEACADAYFEAIAKCVEPLEIFQSMMNLSQNDDEIQYEVCKLLASMAYFRCETRCSPTTGT